MMGRHDSKGPGLMAKVGRIRGWWTWRAESPCATGLKLKGDLGGLSLPRQVMALAIWPLLEQLLSYLVGTVDMALAGHLDPASEKVAATGALGVTAYFGWLMGMIHMTVGVGATALISRAIGGRHRGLANAALGQSLLLAGFSGVVVGAAVYALARVIGQDSGLQGRGLELCIQYLRTVSLAGPFSAVLLVGGAAMRGAGDTRTPFIIMLVVNAVNMVASMLMVYGPGPIGGHGVWGIAAGTFIAWTVGCALTLLVLVNQWGGVIRLHLHRLRPHAHTLRRIVRVGGPNLLESVLGMWLGNYLVLRIVGRMGGEAMIGAHMIAIRVESISFLSGFALSIAASTLTGQYLGANNPQRAKQAVLLCWAAAAVLMGSFGLVFMAAPQWLAAIMTDSPELLGHCLPLIRICGPIQVFFAAYLIFSGALRGAGDTRTTMWMTSLSTFLVRVPAAYGLGVVMGLGLPGIWLGLCGELVFRGVIFAGRFWHGGWSRVRV